jgi:dynein heavy chain
VLFDTFLEPALRFVRKFCAEPVPTVNNNLARSLMNILDTVFARFIVVEGQASSVEPPTEEELANLIKHIEPLFLFALVWSVGATTDKGGREKFDTFLRGMMLHAQVKEPMPEGGQCYDFLYDLAQCKWVGWMSTIAEFTVDPKLSFAEIIVPTVDSIRYTYLLNALVKQQRHVLFTGETGTGKTVNVQQYLAGVEKKFQPISLAFSAATSANMTQDTLDGKMEKRRLRTYGPPLGSVYVVFVDDMNMPMREKYFAQPPIELLRQWMDYKGWFDRKTLTFNNIVDIMFVGAMGPPGGGRNPITPRFLRHFNQVAHTEIEKNSLYTIFSTIITAFVENFGDDIKQLSGAVTTSTIEVYNTIAREMRPTPSKSHYTFNLRDLAKVFQVCGEGRAAGVCLHDIPSGGFPCVGVGVFFGWFGCF